MKSYACFWIEFQRRSTSSKSKYVTEGHWKLVVVIFWIHCIHMSMTYCTPKSQHVTWLEKRANILYTRYDRVTWRKPPTTHAAGSMKNKAHHLRSGVCYNGLIRCSTCQRLPPQQNHRPGHRTCSWATTKRQHPGRPRCWNAPPIQRSKESSTITWRSTDHNWKRNYLQLNIQN